MEDSDGDIRDMDMENENVKLLERKLNEMEKQQQQIRERLAAVKKKASAKKVCSPQLRRSPRKHHAINKKEAAKTPPDRTPNQTPKRKGSLSPKDSLRRRLSVGSTSSISSAASEGMDSGRKRRRKCKKMRNLRKLCGVQMGRFDEALAEGKFWDADYNLFKKDEFREAIVDDIPLIIGRSPKDPNLAHTCFKMCLDIVKRRRRYLKSHIDLTVDDKEDSQIDMTVQVKPEVKPEVKAEVKAEVKPEQVTASDGELPSASQIEELFKDDSQSQEFECAGCQKYITLEECYPESDRGDASYFMCLQCWEKAEASAVVETENAKNYRSQKKDEVAAAAAKISEAKGNSSAKRKSPETNANKSSKTNANKSPKSRARKSPKVNANKSTKSNANKSPKSRARKSSKVNANKSPKSRANKSPKSRANKSPEANVEDPKEQGDPKFKVGDTVIGYWPETNAWFQAQIFTYSSSGKYGLYFPEDGAVYTDAPEHHLKRPKKGSNWSKLRRTDFLEIEFEHCSDYPGTPKKKGNFVVQKVGTGVNINKYVCEYVVKRGRKKDTKKYYFDIGYVQKKLIKFFFPLT